MLLPGTGTTNPIRPNQYHMVSLVGCGIWGVCALSLGSCTLISNWSFYLAVQLVLVPDAGRICVGAERIYLLGKLPTCGNKTPRADGEPKRNNTSGKRALNENSGESDGTNEGGDYGNHPTTRHTNVGTASPSPSNSMDITGKAAIYRAPSGANAMQAHGR